METRPQVPGEPLFPIPILLPQLTYFCLQWLTLLVWLLLRATYTESRKYLGADLLASDSAWCRDKNAQPPCLIARHKLTSRLSLPNEAEHSLWDSVSSRSCSVPFSCLSPSLLHLPGSSGNVPLTHHLSKALLSGSVSGSLT